MIWRLYLRQLQARPMTTKACTSSVTFTITDLLAQKREAGTDPVIDPVRTLRSGLFGFLWLGPTNHFVWGRTRYIGLDWWFPGPSWRMVLSRVAVDQVTNMPLNMVVFHSWHPLLTGKGVEAAAQNVREALWPSLCFAWSIWPLVHPLSFRYVPIEHRLLVLNVCSLCVFSYATWVAERQPSALKQALTSHGDTRALREQTS